MDLRYFPDPILTTPCQPFDFNNPQFDPHIISNEMIKFCNEKKGIGLSANQIGLPYQLFVILGSETYACFNPKIINMSKEILLEESCLSYPGLSVKVKRAGEIRLRFQTPSGGTDTKTFHGLSARTILHEMDHLQGIPFWQKANRFHREQAFNKRNKIMRQQNDKYQ